MKYSVKITMHQAHGDTPQEDLGYWYDLLVRQSVDGRVIRRFVVPGFTAEAVEVEAVRLLLELNHENIHSVNEKVDLYRLIDRGSLLDFPERSLSWMKVHERDLAERPISFAIWQRDCDNCEWTELHQGTSLVDAHRRLTSILEGAEGPVIAEIISREEACCFKPHVRDRVAEAMDDGGMSPYRV